MIFPKTMRYAASPRKIYKSSAIAGEVADGIIPKIIFVFLVFQSWTLFLGWWGLIHIYTLQLMLLSGKQNHMMGICSFVTNNTFVKTFYFPFRKRRFGIWLFASLVLLYLRILLLLICKRGTAHTMQCPVHNWLWKYLLTIWSLTGKVSNYSRIFFCSLKGTWKPVTYF